MPSKNVIVRAKGTRKKAPTKKVAQKKMVNKKVIAKKKMIAKKKAAAKPNRTRLIKRFIATVPTAKEDDHSYEVDDFKKFRTKDLEKVIDAVKDYEVKLEAATHLADVFDTAVCALAAIIWDWDDFFAKKTNGETYEGMRKHEYEHIAEGLSVYYDFPYWDVHDMGSEFDKMIKSGKVKPTLVRLFKKWKSCKPRGVNIDHVIDHIPDAVKFSREYSGLAPRADCELINAAFPGSLENKHKHKKY